MIRLLQSPWMVSLIGCLTYLATTVALIQPTKLQGAHAPVADTDPTLGPSWNFSNPDLDSMVAELKAKKDALDQREQSLNELAARLQAAQQEVFAVTQAVAQLQQQFDANVVRLKSDEAANLRKLAKLHAAMSPQASAAILKELKDEDVAKILAYMKVDEAAAVLQAFSQLGTNEARRAALLSDRLRRTIAPAP